MLTQLSAFNTCLSSIDAAVPAIAHAGFENLSLHFSRDQFRLELHEFDEFEVHELRHLLTQYELQLAVVSAEVDWLTEAGSLLAAATAAATGALQCEVLELNAPDFTGVPAAEAAQQLEAAVNALRRTAEAAQEADVVVCLRTGQASTATADRCLDLLAAVNHPGLGLSFDPTAAAAAEPLAELDQVFPFLAHVRLGDSTMGLGHQCAEDPPSLSFDLSRLLSELKNGGYGGSLSVTTVGGHDDSQRGESLAATYEELVRLVT